MKKLKWLWLSIALFLSLIVIVISVAGIRLSIRTNSINDDYNNLYSDKLYEEAVEIENINVIKQDISCGYAVIEMISSYYGKGITEESLYNTYGRVVTSTGKSFEHEMNKQFSEYKTTMYKYESNSSLLKRAHTSLKDGKPVPFEWAAKLDDIWTLHYSLIVGMDLSNDKIKILNPYGYVENISIREFLTRTSFKAYEGMPLFLKMGFMFDIFEKNTIFIIEEK